MGWKKRIGAIFMSVALLLSGSGGAVTALAEEVHGGNAPAAVEDSELKVEGVNSFGSLLADVLETEADKQEENNGCNVFSIEMDGNVAAVSFETTQEAALVVGIYDEDGIRMLASGTVNVSPGERDAYVDIEIDTMPQYFYLRGFLVDSQCMRPLCSSYNSPNYTREMQEFLAKTTDDFDTDRVLDLDGDKTNNFAVYSQDTIMIPNNPGSNEVTKVDEDSNTYVIEKIDDNISSLKAGDIFAYDYGDEVLIIKVASISINGTEAVITGAETSMEEVFDYVKIDSASNAQDIVVDASACEEGVSYDGKVEASEDAEEDAPQAYDIEGENSSSFAEKFSFVDKKLFGSIKLSGNVELQAKAKIKVYISFSSQYVEVRLDYKVKTAISLSGKARGSIPLARFDISPIPGVYISFTPSFVVEAGAKLEVSGVLSGTVGFSASLQEGIKNLTTTPELKAEVKGEVTIFVGISLEPKIVILSDRVAEAKIEAELGGEIKGVLSFSTDALVSPSSSKYHECASCVDGEIAAKAGISFEIRFLGSEKLKLELSKEFSVKIADFYYSFDYGEFGFTSCPHYRYKTAFTVCGADGKELPGAVIQVMGQNIMIVTAAGTKESVTELVTDSRGRAEGYLPSGNYSVTVKAQDYPAQKQKVTVEDKAKSVRVRMRTSGGSSGGDSEGEDDTDAAANAGQTLLLNEALSGAIAEDGSLYMWGWNGYGQVGNGSTEDQRTPVKVLESVVSVAVGSYSTGAITEDGSLYMWGENGGGQVGDGSSQNQLTPIKILDNVVSMALGSGHSGAITEDGSLYMWGGNPSGQVGNGNKQNQLTPIKVLDDVISVSLGEGYTGAITEDGSLYMWGYGRGVGNGSNQDQLTPVKVLDNVTSVSLRFAHSGAITEDGSLYMWGLNDYGRLGNGNTENQLTPIKVLDSVTAVALGDCYTGAVTEDGGLYMWGYNGYGQVGNGNTENQLTPIKVLDSVTSVSFGSQCTSAVTEDGSLYMWGYNVYGQVGNGNRYRQLTPIKVLDNVASVSLGSGHSGAVTEDGSLYMWGLNGDGQAGNGNTGYTYQLTPIKILDNVASVSLGSVYSGAITEDRSLYMWGGNKYGQIGNGSTYTSQWSPVKVLDNIRLPHAASRAGMPYHLTASVLSDRGTELQADFTGLMPDETYNFYVMKDQNAQDPLNPSNLFYITQAVSNQDGSLSISYQPTQQAENADIFLVRMKQTDLSAVQVELADLEETGEIQYVHPIVTLNGEILAEGKDYELSGDYSAKDAGEYYVTIQGINLYTGKLSASYKVVGKSEMAGDLTYINGKYYFYENGVMASSKEAYVNGAWRWFDADGTMAVDKDVYQLSYAGPYADNEDGTGKWVRYNEEGEMIKGEDYRYGGWYRFDEETGAMVKGWYRAENGALYYYDWFNGQMVHGEYQIDGRLCFFDPITGIAADCIWVPIDGSDYWYENGIRQGLEGRGKEIYDPASDAWYWLDSIDQGKKAVSKDVYQESYSAYPDREDGTGKWVRYDENGHMVKGWQSTDAGTYYFEQITGAMAKGKVTIDGAEHYFDEITGIMRW